MRTARFSLIPLVLVAAVGCGNTHKATTTSLPGTRTTVSNLREKMCNARAKKQFAGIKGGPWKHVTASTFYIGEEANTSNANISNITTAWSEFAVSDFGGVDSWGPINPDDWDGQRYQRNGFCPKDFRAKENIFYLALPTLDHDEHGRVKAAEKQVRNGARYLPELQRFHHGRFREDQSPFKNLWVEVVFHGRSAFGQLEDIGPSDKHDRSVSDYKYVWGKAKKPKNKFGMHAGIDLSPALTDYLGTDGKGKIHWRFVPAKQVPDGPWTAKTTTSGPHWG
jgi:hypothetical protein